MTATATVGAITHSVAGAVITVTRPNNATPYVAGQVYGDGADARIALPVPAAPAGFVFGMSLSMFAVLTRPSSDAGLPAIFPYLFSAAPVTVLKDQDAFSIVDADIALAMPGSSDFTPAQLGNQTFSGLNPAAGVNGRRVIGSGNWNLSTSSFFVPGTTAYFYLKMNAAWTPVGLETIRFTPLWGYSLASNV